MYDEFQPTTISSPVRIDYDVFLSYSRRDKTFSQQLWKALEARGKRVWVDWNDIAPAEDWRDEIRRGIECSSNFIFVISAHSVISENCREELNYALSYNKRLIPVVCCDADFTSSDCHPALARHNWVFCRECDDFEQALHKVNKAIDLEMPYVRQHTQLLVKAQDWQSHDRDASFLLRGRELQEALAWLDASAGKKPEPSALHQALITASAEEEAKQQAHEMALRRMTPQQVRNRNAILSKVKNIWIKGVLEASLHDQILIDLGLEDRAEAVTSAWNLELQTDPDRCQVLLPGTKVVTIFDQLGDGRTLLILGEPGAGKTTTLLELTRDLLQRAEQGFDSRIPIVLNLSSWGAKQHNIPLWVVDELHDKYQVPKPVGREWLQKQELVLLLDGLDEVAADYQDACIQSLNAFHRDYGPEMVVCSRMQDYASLSKRLHFQQALYLKALTLSQVFDYLDSLETDMSGLRHLIATDEALQALARSPLNLNLMAIAYQGTATTDLPHANTLEERRSQLFNTYIRRMFNRPSRLSRFQPYSPEETIAWLRQLAQQLIKESQTVFLIEHLQSNWLPKSVDQIYYKLVFPLLFGFVFGFLWLIQSLILQTERPFVSALLSGLIITIIMGIDGGRIMPVENLRWSWTNAKKNLPKAALYTLAFMVFFVAIFTLLGGTEFIPAALFFGLIYGLLFGVAGAFQGSNVTSKIEPNQGIGQSVKNSLIFGPCVGLVVGVLVTLALKFMGFPVTFAYYFQNTLFFTLAALLLGGGKAAIQHLVLRYLLYRRHQMPWNYARFLDYACDRIFLQKVGGGYIFIHRLLLEHFAKLRSPSL